MKENMAKASGKFEEYELEDACRTLLRAEEIKADLKLMAALKPHLDKKEKAHKSLKEMRKLAVTKTKEENAEATKA